jgi:hypothetical protein
MSLVLLLAAAAAGAPICADRPTKANAVCTVPAGMLQVESGLAGWSVTQVAGTRTTLVTVAPTTLKLGLTDSSDLELAMTPYARVRVQHGGSISGFGDVLVRYKQKLTADSAPVQAAVIPFVKLPTASNGLGNGRVEGGLAVPISFAIAGSATMTLGPEADLLADDDGQGRHVAVVNLVNVSGPIAPRLTLAVELWSNLNFDPAHTIRQASADAALSYAASNDVQLDAGMNFGLNRATADVELYAGASMRF